MTACRLVACCLSAFFACAPSVAGGGAVVEAAAGAVCAAAVPGRPSQAPNGRVAATSAAYNGLRVKTCGRCVIGVIPIWCASFRRTRMPLIRVGGIGRRLAAFLLPHRVALSSAGAKLRGNPPRVVVCSCRLSPPGNIGSIQISDADWMFEAVVFFRGVPAREVEAADRLSAYLRRGLRLKEIGRAHV